MKTLELLTQIDEVTADVTALAGELDERRVAAESAAVREAAVSVKSGLLAAAAGLDQAAHELVRVFGAEVRERLAAAETPKAAVALVNELRLDAVRKPRVVEAETDAEE